MSTARNNNRPREAGNAFLIIMIGVVLFAALMYTFSRSARQGGENLSDRQLSLLASDITAYGQELERATARVMLTGISETQLSFTHTGTTAYDNAGDCGSDKCRVFAPDGGAGTWMTPPANANDGSDYIIAGTNAVPGVGDDAAADLILLLPGVTQSLCTKIDQTLNVNAGQIPALNGILDTTLFTGTFANTGRLTTTPALTGIRAACLQNGGAYVFYSVLMER